MYVPIVLKLNRNRIMSYTKAVFDGDDCNS